MTASARFLCVALVVLSVSLPVRAFAVDYDEGVDGDLSGTPAAPTSLGTLDVGANNLTATSGGGDFDLLTLSIGGGNELASIVLDSYSGPSVSFTGLQGGTIWTEGLGAAIDASNLLGWAHFGGAALGTDILDNIGTGAGASGFVPPLPAGDYTFLLQDTGGAVSYDLTFNVVPEPSTFVLAGLGCLLVVTAALRGSSRRARR